jgi:hypothetical protein
VNHYTSVKGGDDVLIDMGGHGLFIQVDPKGGSFDATYVNIEYDGTTRKPAKLLAQSTDMVLSKGAGKAFSLDDAMAARILTKSRQALGGNDVFRKPPSL